MKDRRDSAQGIALVLVSGILVLLAVASTAMLNLAGQTRFQAAHATDQASARLSARSGIEYAAARLFQDPVPRMPPSMDNQTDDWTYRDGASISLDRSLNPSYAQTEPYYDLTKDGAFDGVDTYTDVNGNGRFDSWSGRLRNPHGAAGGTFVLKLLGESGKINLNGGRLDALNRNAADGNTVPDHRDVDEIRNRRYVLLLDNLGQIVNVSSTGQDPNVLQNGAASRLGDLLNARPYGGFRSLEEVRGRLSASDWSKVKDFLTVTEVERAKFSILDETGPMGSNPYVRRLGAEARPLVNLGTASKEVIEALVLGLRLWLTSPPGFLVSAQYRPIDPAMSLKTSDFLGKSPPFAGWYDLYVKLRGENSSVDPESAGYEASVPITNALLMANGGTAIYPALSWANVVFGNLIADEVGGYAFCGNECQYYWSPPMSWHTYDAPRATAPDAPHFHLIRKMGPNQVSGDLGVVTRFEGGRPPLPPSSNQFGVYKGGTLEVSLIPREVSAFSIDCLGRSRTDVGRSPASSAASALFRFGEIVSARTQAEFENLSGFSDHGYYKVTGRPFKDRTQTEPQFSIDSLPPALKSSYLSAHPDSALYSPFWGTVRLADRSGYRQGELFYVPAWDMDQPLRPPVDPVYFRDNFRIEDDFQDISGSSDFVYQWRPMLTGNGPDPITSSEAVFRGDRAAHFHCAAAPGVSAPGSYTWFKDKKFALDDGSGNATRGTIELWTTGRPGGLLQRRLALYWTASNFFEITGSNSSGISKDNILYPAAMNVDGHFSSPVLLGDWHHLAVALDSNSAPTMFGYLDGRPDPFLVNDDWKATAMNPASGYDPRWIVGQGFSWPSEQRGGYLGSEVDELRLYDRALNQSEAMARAATSRYWTEEQFSQAGWPKEIGERLRGLPSFTSPLYVFNRPVALEGARWDGFVPQLIQQAVDGIGLTPGNPAAAPPMKVELLCYSDPDGMSAPRVVPFPAGLWRTGGGWAEFKEMWKSAYPDEPIPRFWAYRYRVWMDCSAVGGFNPETPVFDSISVVVRAGEKLLGLSEQ